MSDGPVSWDVGSNVNILQEASELLSLTSRHQLVVFLGLAKGNVISLLIIIGKSRSQRHVSPALLVPVDEWLSQVSACSEVADELQNSFLGVVD